MNRTLPLGNSSKKYCYDRTRTDPHVLNSTHIEKSHCFSIHFNINKRGKSGLLQIIMTIDLDLISDEHLNAAGWNRIAISILNANEFAIENVFVILVFFTLLLISGQDEIRCSTWQGSPSQGFLVTFELEF